MPKFNAGQAVERLEYDFSDFGGTKGHVTEPTTGRVNTFFASMRAMIKESRALQDALGNVNIEEMDDEQMAAKLGDLDEATNTAAELQERTVENLAMLCGATWSEDEEQGPELVGGSPTFEELSNLPYRVLQAFMQWLIEEIKPKKAAPAGKR